MHYRVHTAMAEMNVVLYILYVTIIWLNVVLYIPMIRMNVISNLKLCLGYK
jgi:hypothetical protein